MVRLAAAVGAAALALWLGQAMAMTGFFAPLTVVPHGPESALRPRTGALVPRARHVFLIVMENRGASAIESGVGDPYLHALIRQYALATRFYAVTHPSLPNYLALLGGSTFGVDSDTAAPDIAAKNLTDVLFVRGLGFGAYMDGLPSAGFLGGSDWPGLYVARHDPFRYFTDIRRNPARRARIEPLGALWRPLQEGRLPAFVWITPNLCHDMHSCPTFAGDNWLRLVVPRILASPAWRDRGLLFITWDEGTGDSPAGPGHGGRVALLVIAPGERPGARLTAPADDYALLRTIEDALGTACVGRSCGARPLDLRRLLLRAEPRRRAA